MLAEVSLAKELCGLLAVAMLSPLSAIVSVALNKLLISLLLVWPRSWKFQFMEGKMAAVQGVSAAGKV